MQVRIFESADMATGLKQIKQELGPDALILSTRTVKKGSMGMIGKPTLEITAAIDKDYVSSRAYTKENRTFSNSRPKEMFSLHKGSQKKSNGFTHVIDDPTAQYLTPGTSPAQKDDTRIAQQETNNRTSADLSGAEYQLNHPLSLKDEVKELKSMVSALSTQLNGINRSSPFAARKIPKASDAHLQQDHMSNEQGRIHGDHILRMLLDQGVNVESSRTIAGFLRETLTEQELGDDLKVQSTLIDTIQSLIEVAAPDFENKKERQHRIALVGPTGVGKTTTLAKICASYLSHHSRSIAMITIDTYRIAAVEQLKVYGDIMQIPVDVVLTPEQLKESLEKHKDKDLILIDTAGRSPRDKYRIDELADFLVPELEIEKHLVLSASSRENELLETISRFNPLGLSNTIFTKLDECLNHGVLLNIQTQNSHPLSYLTNGQRVPEDLISITPKKAAELIMSIDKGSMHE
jgi:flagellar biosynthesis protein FlhF